ncbi:MAG: amidohydrolase family protein [Chloroflexi bacterium]|nr:amidohydrolase family protein [Chloroflexota bacterium]MCI0781978.1 amidohydrolase family protein [Chloroflexota bacterium]MCI0784770.1 amidohydrolase family protein [Chloroflexota bacterium]MCI0792119.1 amidohydrolase family protein [Chloroflexota bacterium]MCI0865500.1 amidohydrolase family protein [Chloroflexota bacterium]
MRVDVHTHVWPESIAGTVLEYMERDMGIAAISKNTVESVKAHMRESGVDKSVVLGVVQRADQVRRANDWLIGIQDEMLVPFGAMHPDLEDKAAEVQRLRQNGIKGIKLHPVLNSFYPDDPKMFPVYEEMGDSMTLEIHSGRLPGAKPGETVFAAPERIMNVVRQFPKLKVIALHLGGFYMLDEAERELIGKENVLIDTTWPPSLKEVGAETLTTIIRKHGSHKVCFGTDFPLASQAAEGEYIQGLPLSDADKEGILGENARMLIGL